MLELGKAGSAGVERGVVPVLRDGEVVAMVSAARWKEAATAMIGHQEWCFAKRKRVLTARWATDPEDAPRLRARQTSTWKSTWALDLEGRPADLRPASRWKGTYSVEFGGRRVAELGSAGGWSRRPTLTDAEQLPLHQQGFLLWGQLLLLRPAAAATAGGATAAS